MPLSALAGGEPLSPPLAPAPFVAAFGAPATVTDMPSRSFNWPAVTIVSPGGNALDDLDAAVAALAELDLRPRCLAVDDAIHVLLLALRHQRLLGKDQRIAIVLREQAHAREHRRAAARCRRS